MAVTDLTDTRIDQQIQRLTDLSQDAQSEALDLANDLKLASQSNITIDPFPPAEVTLPNFTELGAFPTISFSDVLSTVLTPTDITPPVGGGFSYTPYPDIAIVYGVVYNAPDVTVNFPTNYRASQISWENFAVDVEAPEFEEEREDLAQSFQDSFSSVPINEGLDNFLADRLSRLGGGSGDASSYLSPFGSTFQANLKHFIDELLDLTGTNNDQIFSPNVVSQMNQARVLRAFEMARTAASVQAETQKQSLVNGFGLSGHRLPPLAIDDLTRRVNLTSQLAVLQATDNATAEKIKFDGEADLRMKLAILEQVHGKWGQALQFILAEQEQGFKFIESNMSYAAKFAELLHTMFQDALEEFKAMISRMQAYHQALQYQAQINVEQNKAIIEADARFNDNLIAILEADIKYRDFLLRAESERVKTELAVLEGEVGIAKLETEIASTQNSDALKYQALVASLEETASRIRKESADFELAKLTTDYQQKVSLAEIEVKKREYELGKARLQLEKFVRQWGDYANLVAVNFNGQVDQYRTSIQGVSNASRDVSQLAQAAASAANVVLSLGSSEIENKG